MTRSPVLLSVDPRGLTRGSYIVFLYLSVELLIIFRYIVYGDSSVSFIAKSGFILNRDNGELKEKDGIGKNKLHDGVTYD